jgi:hypothetical protein
MSAQRVTLDDFNAIATSAVHEVSRNGHASPERIEAHSSVPIDLVALGDTPIEPPSVGGIVYQGGRHILEELLAYVVERRVNDLSYRGMRSLAAYLADRLGFKLFTDAGSLEAAIYAIESRNVTQRVPGTTLIVERHPPEDSSGRNAASAPPQPG